MSSPNKYKRATWRPDRLASAMKSRNLDSNGLRALINRLRAENDQIPVCLRTIRNWLDESHSPMMGRTGHEPSVFEIAYALQLSLDWLCGTDPKKTAKKSPGPKKAGR